MITWIQTVLQKHHKIVFGALLIAIIIAFVFTVGAVPFFGDSPTSNSKVDRFYALNLKDPSSVQRYQNCVFYELVFAGQEAQLQNQEIFTQLVLRQAYLKDVANKLGMLKISDADMLDYIKTSPIFADTNGQFDSKKFDGFIASRTATGKISEEEITAIIAQNALINKVAKLLGGPGYIPAFEIIDAYDKQYGTWDFKMASISYTDFNPTIEPTEEQLEKYFNDNIEAYRVGEGAMLESVFIPSKDFESAYVGTDTELLAYYSKNSDKYATVINGVTQPSLFSDVKDAVKVDVAKENALRLAADKAENLVLEIYDAEVAKASAELKKILDEAKVEVKALAPVRLTDKGLPEGVPAQVAAAGLKLDDAKFYTDPISAEDGAWILFLVNKLDSYLPKYADVKDDVKQNYLQAEKIRLFNETAQSLATALKSAVEEKKSFDDVASEGGATVTVVEKFSLSSLADLKPEVRNAMQAIVSTLPKLKDNQVSDVQISGDLAYIFELVKFEKPTEANKEQLDMVSQRMKAMFSNITSMQVVSEKLQQANPAE